MITSKAHPRWPGDTSITDLSAAGLQQPRIVRLKLFTLDNRLIPRIAGHLAQDDATGVDAEIGRHLTV